MAPRLGAPSNALSNEDNEHALKKPVTEVGRLMCFATHGGNCVEQTLDSLPVSGTVECSDPDTRSSKKAQAHINRLC